MLLLVGKQLPKDVFNDYIKNVNELENYSKIFFNIMDTNNDNIIRISWKK